MSALNDLFNSPPRPAPARSPVPSSPPSPALALNGRNGNGVGGPSTSNPLFLSPGGESVTSHSNRLGRGGSRSPSPSLAATRPYAPAVSRAGREASPERTYATHELGFEDPFAALNAPAQTDEEQGTKRKRVMAKVDADRLTSDRGIPALCRAAKKFKVRGKGNETKDLRNLLDMYQMWAHGMFPKGDFAHTIGRVEVVCRTHRMESAIAGYRDAFYPRARSPTPPLSHSRALTPSSPVETNHVHEQEHEQEPLFTAPPAGLDPDLEEMMALEEMEREQQAEAPSTSLRHSAVADDGPPVLEEENDWDGLYD